MARSTGFWTFFAIAGVAALCRCSLVFDPSELGRGAPGARDAGAEAAVVDATGDGETGPVELDASSDGGGGSDAVDAGADDGPSVDAAVDARADGANVDARVDAAGADAAANAVADAATPDATADATADAATFDAAPDAGSIAVGLVAFYPFDEASGTTSADISGNGHTATMSGATFAAGVRGNAAAMNGNGQYVSLPNDILNGLTSVSVCAWVNFNALLTYSRIFDFGTGQNVYMFLTPGVRFAITVGGRPGEQRVDAPVLATNSWQHVAVTMAGTTSTIYVNGVVAAQGTTTLNPASLTTTTQNWLGRGEYASDPYQNGRIDQVRIYSRALSAAEIQQLFQLQL
ncbi:MAG: hypothetical protein M3O46_23655 [Myxococcota bacterium]|nr:hypothetical protein [Myxococcota bacterium]